MKKSIFAVCDLEASYAYNLMEAIDETQGSSFEVQAFTNVERLIAYAGERHIELLLISAAAMCGELLKLSIGKIMILSEGEKKKELSEYPCIYKYQASDQLIAEVMNYYAVEAVPAPMAMLKKKVEIVGIYSPVGRCMKTSLALTYGQLLAREHKVLYLNLEEYAGFETLLEETYEADLTDLLYFARLGSGNLVYRLGSLICHLGALDYIPPAFCPEDLRNISPGEWLSLIRDLAEYSAYEVLLLDIGPAVNGTAELLKLCTRIFMPMPEDEAALAKAEQYEKVLKQQNVLEVLEKTRKLSMPFVSGSGKGKAYMEQLIWGELGDLARQLIREENEGGMGTGRTEPSKKAPGAAGSDTGSERPGDLQADR